MSSESKSAVPVPSYLAKSEHVQQLISLANSPPDVLIHELEKDIWTAAIYSREFADWTQIDLIHLREYCKLFHQVHLVHQEIMENPRVLSANGRTYRANPKTLILKTLQMTLNKTAGLLRLVRKPSPTIIKARARSVADVQQEQLDASNPQPKSPDPIEPAKNEHSTFMPT